MNTTNSIISATTMSRRERAAQMIRERGMVERSVARLEAARRPPTTKQIQRALYLQGKASIAAERKAAAEAKKAEKAVASVMGKVFRKYRLPKRTVVEPTRAEQEDVAAALFAELPVYEPEEEMLETAVLNAEEMTVISSRSIWNGNLTAETLAFPEGFDSSDLELVRTILTEFFTRNFARYYGHRIFFALSFVEREVALYRSRNEVFDTVEPLIDLLLSRVQKYLLDSAKYDDDQTFSLKYVMVYTYKLSGGCSGCKLDIKNLQKQISGKAWSPPTKNNTCAIACFERVKQSHVTAGGKTGKLQDLKQILASATNIHKQLGFKDDKVSLKDLEKVCDHYQISATVYECKGASFEELASIGEYDSKINLLLHVNHYHLITDMKLVKNAQCPTCKKWYLDVEEHKKVCKFCTVCRKSYNSKKEHECPGKNDFKANSIIPLTDSKAQDQDEEAGLIYWDIETFVRTSRRANKVVPKDLIPYAIGWALNDGDVNFELGYHCFNNFISELQKLAATGEYKKYILIAHNGASFDLLPLVNELREHDIDFTMIRSNGSFKKVEFKLDGVTFETWDSWLHLNASLDKCCESFSVPKELCKGTFDHRKIQRWNHVSQFKSEWLPYLKNDILALRCVVENYQKSSMDAFGSNVFTAMTASQLAFKNFRKNIDAPIAVAKNKGEDDWIRRGLYGGRVFPQKQYFKSADADTDFLVDLDVVSLYPTVMEKFQYPVDVPDFKCLYDTLDLNQRKSMEGLKDMMNGMQCWPTKEQGNEYAMGLLEVDLITRKDLVMPILPAKTEGLGLSWDLKDKSHQVYTTVDLNEALRMGYKIKTVYKAMLWKHENCDYIFKNYVNKCFVMKKNAAKGTASYEIAKLFMNAIYGKMCQRPIDRDEVFIRDEEEYQKFFLDHDGDVDMALFEGYEKIYLTGRKPDHRIRVAKPAHIGALILSQARCWVNQYIHKINGFTDLDSAIYRTDTDSLIVHAKHIPALDQFIGTGLGQLDFDIQGRIVEYAEPAPKLYCCDYLPWDKKTKEVSDYTDIHAHVRAKGFGKAFQKQLTMVDFRRMLFGGDATPEVTPVQETFRGKEDKEYHVGDITRTGDQIMAVQFDRIQRDFIPRVTGERHLAKDKINVLCSRRFQRTMNKTRWSKRTHIPNHPNMASLPVGYEGVYSSMLVV